MDQPGAVVFLTELRELGWDVTKQCGGSVSEQDMASGEYALGPGQWHPTVRSGDALVDTSLAEWIGQAIGAASTCWIGGTSGAEFDSAQAKYIADGLHAHVQKVLDGVSRGTRAERDRVQDTTFAEYKTAMSEAGNARQNAETSANQGPYKDDERRATMWAQIAQAHASYAQAAVIGRVVETEAANLGYATTVDLLGELRARFETGVTGSMSECEKDARACVVDMAEELPDSILAYRTAGDGG